MRLKDIYKNEDEYEDNPRAFEGMRFKAWAEPHEIDRDFVTRVCCGFIEPGEKEINTKFQPPCWVEEIIHGLLFPPFQCSQDENAKGRNRASLLITGTKPIGSELQDLLTEFEKLVKAAVIGEFDPYG